MPWRERFLASSSPECFVSKTFSFATVTIRTLFAFSSPWLKDRAFADNVKEVHGILAHALVSLAAMHAAAALIHHWIFRDRTLVRMLPHSNK